MPSYQDSTRPWADSSSGSISLKRDGSASSVEAEMVAFVAKLLG